MHEIKGGSSKWINENGFMSVGFPGRKDIVHFHMHDKI